MNFQLLTMGYSVSTDSYRMKFIIICFVRNMPTFEVIIKRHYHFLNLILECSISHRLTLIWCTFNYLRADTVFRLIRIIGRLLSPNLSVICWHKCLNGFAQKYLVDLLEVQESCRALRSNKKNRLKLPMTRTKTLGTRAFTYAAPAVWNSLPDKLKTTKCIKAFKILLKTHYFEIAYN